MIARQLGKEFLLNVATDLRCGEDWLAFSARGSSEVVRINMLGIDRFEHNGHQLYAHQLRESVEVAIGQYDDIHAEVEAIFAEAQMEQMDRERLRYDLWAARRVDEKLRHDRYATDVARKSVAGQMRCRCGCGLPLSPKGMGPISPFFSRGHRERWERENRPKAAARYHRMLVKNREQTALRRLAAARVCACGATILPKHGPIRSKCGACLRAESYEKRKRATAARNQQRRQLIWPTSCLACRQKIPFCPVGKIPKYHRSCLLQQLARKAA